MEPWGWILAYLVGFTLFQLLLFRYFSDGRALGDVSVGPGEATGSRSVDAGHPTVDGDGNGGSEPDGTDALRCPHCGVENADDTQFTYCRNCLAQLG